MRKSGGVLMFSPERSIKVIAATAILHICMVYKTLLPEADDPDVSDEEEDKVDDGENIINNGEQEVDRRGARQNLVNTLFSRA